MPERIRILDTTPGHRVPFSIEPQVEVTVDTDYYTPALRPLAPSLEGAFLYFLVKQLERKTCPSTK